MSPASFIFGIGRSSTTTLPGPLKTTAFMVSLTIFNWFFVLQRKGGAKRDYMRPRKTENQQAGKWSICGPDGSTLPKLWLGITDAGVFAEVLASKKFISSGASPPRCCGVVVGTRTQRKHICKVDIQCQSNCLKWAAPQTWCSHHRVIGE